MSEELPEDLQLTSELHGAEYLAANPVVQEMIDVRDPVYSSPTHDPRPICIICSRLNQMV